MLNRIYLQLIGIWSNNNEIKENLVIRCYNKFYNNKNLQQYYSDDIFACQNLVYIMFTIENLQYTLPFVLLNNTEIFYYYI